MVFLQRKRPPPHPPAAAERPAPPLRPRSPPSPPPSSTSSSAFDHRRHGDQKEEDGTSTLISVLADAGCTITSSTPPSLPSEGPHRLRRLLECRFSSDPSLLPRFLSGLSLYIQNPSSFRRFLLPSAPPSDGVGMRGDSLARVLLLVPTLQPHLQRVLLEKLPEHFLSFSSSFPSSTSLSLKDDVARLIINQFRWLDFIVDPEGFSDKLMEVLSICPLPLKKEIVGSFPEILGDKNSANVVIALEKMLHEDLDVIVPVLDSLSNLNLDDNLQEQAITIVLSCIRTVDTEFMPHLLRFLLLSATSTNSRRIISQIRVQLQFVSMTDPHAARNKMLKGKSLASSNAELLTLETLRSSLRLKNILCEAVLKEIKGLNQPRDHKVIDIWLLILIYANGGSLQKSAEKLLKKKIIEGCFREPLFDQCIRGHKELVKNYFSSYLSICEHLLACKEKQARDFGIHIYVSLFEEFTDHYSRQEVLGQLVAHIGSGIVYEVNSALDIIFCLTMKHSQDLVPVSSHINGMLDYLEGFSDDNLHKVYEIFCHLALHAQSNADSSGLSIANELFMIVRKQVGNLDIRYKKMGIIGSLKVVSRLANVSDPLKFPSSQKSSSQEALELLGMTLESCKSAIVPSILLYEELVALLDSTTLQPAILEWLGKHVAEFESVFLSDLEEGRLPFKNSIGDLEGELWMNLDGDLSPICLDIWQLLSSSDQCSSTLQTLPVQFLLLSSVERSTNQGSLEGIDALLGCPLHLPSPKYYNEPLWKTLTGTQKKLTLLALYYAINWIRVLLNAFSTQIAGKFNCITQATREETVSKLLKRLRNLMCVEGLLNSVLKSYPTSLPEINSYSEHSGYPSTCKLNKHHYNERKSESEAVSDINHLKTKKKSKKKAKTSEMLDINQPTILDMLKKAGVAVGQERPAESLGPSSNRRMSQSSENYTVSPNEYDAMDISAVPSFLERQRLKFRPLLVDCLFILSFSQGQGFCCSDSAAELPLHLYLIRDFNHKLECLCQSNRPLLTAHAVKAASGLNNITIYEFLSNVKPLFPMLKKHLGAAVCALREGTEICSEHWDSQSASAGNPEFSRLIFSKSSTANFTCREVLCCFSKLLNLPDLFSQRSMPILRDLLEAFQSDEESASHHFDIEPHPVAGTMGYLYCRTYSFLESILDIASSLSFPLASEVVFTLESVVNSIPAFIKSLLEENGKNTCTELSQGLFFSLRRRLGISAKRILTHDWNSDENTWKTRGDTIPKVLHIYVNNNEPASDVLVNLACSVLPQAPFCKSNNIQDAVHGFPTLCPSTFVSWYRVLHEENLAFLNKLIKEAAVLKSGREDQQEDIKQVLLKLHQAVDVVVSLVSMCKINGKVNVHSMAVKYGGKFVDTFLKVFNFLEVHFKVYNCVVIRMVKELQKATRIIQTLCSEAKGSKRTIVTSKIPATKRSMERFLFHVKALLHSSSNGVTFWMGNLKHKDLQGEVVSSQVYAVGEDEEDVPVDDVPVDAEP